MPPMVDPEMPDTSRALQDGHVEIQVQPIEGLDLQGDVLPQNFRDGACYRHGGLPISQVLTGPTAASCGH